MRRLHRTHLLIALGSLLALVLAACSGSSATPTARPTALPTLVANPFAGVPGIVDPDNHGWPREVEGLNGRVTIVAKPQRIVTLSVGHDEMTYALVPAHRVVAVGSSTKNPTYSNVAALAQDLPTISREPEVILAQEPDIMVTSPFVGADVVQALSNAGLTVVQTSLENDPRARIDNILLLGYIYGEEERALELASEVQARFEALRAVVAVKPDRARPRVMAATRYTDKIYTAGAGSTEGGIIDAAGGVNVAAEAGLVRNPIISLESIIAMEPEVIFIPQPLEFGAEEFRQDLLSDPVLAEVPAIADRRVYVVPGILFTTLSFWNLRGAEELAKILWTEDFVDKEFGPFSFPE
ncbi:MAG: ABC transporter substrate-binding protein [Dehalococcoidia bacterium]